MASSKLFLLFFVVVGLSPVIAFGGAEELPIPSKDVCYKVIYDANFNELIKHYNIDYARKISNCTANTYISDFKLFNCKCTKPDDTKICQQIIANRIDFINSDHYAKAVSYHCLKTIGPYK